MPHWLKWFILAIILLGLCSIPLAMQLADGSIQGVVTDAHGPLPGALIEARNIMSGAAEQTTSDVTGRYKLEDLRAGRYSLWIRAENHDSAWIPKVVVDHGQTVRRDVRLATSRGRTTTE
jgi:hypothetical protein